MQIQDILFNEGFGQRRLCAGLVQRALVQVWSGTEFVTVQAASQDIEADIDGLRLRVQGQEWVCHRRAYVMLNKPAGYECSQKPSAWPSVYTLLPTPLRQRPVRGNAIAGVQAVGRLDQDTTGLLLLSDDGAFIHRMSSPKRHVPKTYRITAARPVTAAQREQLLAGVVLADDPRPVQATHCHIEDDDAHCVHLTLTQGKYHQVKRMMAAVGNHVQALQRTHIGALALPLDLAPGQWRWLSAQDMEQLDKPHAPVGGNSSTA